MEQLNPFQELETLRREVDRPSKISAYAGPPFARPSLPGQLVQGYPSMSLHEDADNPYSEAMAFGIDPGTLNLMVVRNTDRLR